MKVINFNEVKSTVGKNDIRRINVEILNTYKEQLAESIKNKLKKDFFEFIKLVMLLLTITFIAVIGISLIIMILMVLLNNSSTEVITGSIVAVISSFATMIVSIFKLPRIIAKYLFNKKEDDQMSNIIENIQKYELGAVKTEKWQERAKADVDEVVGESDSDLEMNDFSYVDPSIDNKKAN